MHCFRDGAAHFLRRLDKVIVRKVGVARHGLVPPVPEQLADQGAVEEPGFRARRVQYQAAVVRTSVRSVWA